MKMTKIAALITGLLILPGCVIHVGANASSADVNIEEKLTLNSADIKTLEIDAGAGFLIVNGNKQATSIDVDADIYTTDDKDYELTLTRKGDKAVLVAKHSSVRISWGDSPKINVTVSVPDSIALDIDDGSGSIDVNNINSNVDIKDGSGSLNVKNIQGNLNIDDGSGSLEVANVSGDVEIEDGSGSMFVTDISGSVNVDDGSGEMVLHHIGGTVVIDDGSGSIEVKDAGGLKITESGSGGVNIKEIRGEVDVDS